MGPDCSEYSASASLEMGKAACGVGPPALMRPGEHPGERPWSLQVTPESLPDCHHGSQDSTSVALPSPTSERHDGLAPKSHFGRLASNHTHDDGFMDPLLMGLNVPPGTARYMPSPAAQPSQSYTASMQEES